MNTSQEQLLLLLTLAIHGEVPTYESFSSINGEELFHLALQQNVYSFLYPTLNKYREEIKLDELIIRRWRVAALYMATLQVSMINGIKTILGIFKSNDISVISLKGLALKKVYPQPELRNMGDLDLFIDEIDIKKSIELLITQGYHPNSKDLNNPKYMHIGMQKPGTFSVELHRTLWHPTIMKKRDNHSWFNHIWENKRQLEMEEIKFTALSLEDELINLVIHLARHLMHSDANLLQLCDIVLFIENHWDIMDREYIDQTIKSMDLFTFYHNLLVTCHLFLGLTLPINSSILERNKSEIFVNYIFNSKIHNRTTDESKSQRTLSDHYIFAHNNKFLIPLASVFEVGRQFMRKMKIFLHSTPCTEKFIKFLNRFNSRARLLRRIGLYYR